LNSIGQQKIVVFTPFD